MKKTFAFILCCLLLTSCTKLPSEFMPSSGDVTSSESSSSKEESSLSEEKSESSSESSETTSSETSSNSESSSSENTSSSEENSSSESSSSESSSSEKSDYEKWLETDGQDLNKDGKIDKDDYDLYVAYKIWEKGEDALDINGDGKITIEDYILYKQYINWVVSGTDYNNDGKVNLTDFMIEVKYLAWKDSDKANDLNGDRKIDYEDYKIFSDPTLNEYLNWFNSPDKYDYNSDSKIDVNDYYLYTTFGYYTISNYVYSGDAELVYFKDNGEYFYFSKLDEYLPGTTFLHSSNGVFIEFGEKLKTALDNNTAPFERVMNNAKINATTLNTFNIKFKLSINGVEGEHTLFFERINNTDNFKTEFVYTSATKGNVKITFDLIRNR